MSQSAPARLRSMWWTLHRWIGVGLCALLVPIAVSGALLVWHDQIDSWINPGRYAVTGAQATQTVAAYVASAQAALQPGAQPVAVRFSEDESSPVRVLARGARSEGGPQRLMTVYLDPPTGRVLDVVDFRDSLFGFLHRFHENLTIPQFSGRSVVGWAGAGMLALSLTGIWLWWPRNGAFLTGLRWRRAPMTITNLHHLIGFWISVPLALVSLTGIYLSFPQNSRSLMASIAPMNPPTRSLFAGQIARDPQLTADSALSTALAKEPGARPVAVFMPTMPAGGDQGRRAGTSRDGERSSQREAASPIWRIQLRKSAGGEPSTLLIDDRTGEVRPLAAPLAGDRAAQWIRWIHEGSHSGPVWRFIVFLTGVAPPVFAVTGVLMWWRGRRQRRAILAARPTQDGSLQAAE